MRIEYATLSDREIVLSILNDMYLSIQEVSKNQLPGGEDKLQGYLETIEDKLLKLSLKHNHDRTRKTLSLKKPMVE